jgi:hypothetical protein
MRWSHGAKFSTFKAYIPETYLRDGMCFRTGSIQFKYRRVGEMFASVIVFARYVIWMWSKMNNM